MVFSGLSQFKGCRETNAVTTKVLITKVRSPHSHPALGDRGRLPQIAPRLRWPVGRIDLKAEWEHLENVKLVTNAAVGYNHDALPER
jgi:hypothetical protein